MDLMQYPQTVQNGTMICGHGYIVIIRQTCHGLKSKAVQMDKNVAEVSNVLFIVLTSSFLFCESHQKSKKVKRKVTG